MGSGKNLSSTIETILSFFFLPKKKFCHLDPRVEAEWEYISTGISAPAILPLEKSHTLHKTGRTYGATWEMR